MENLVRQLGSLSREQFYAIFTQLLDGYNDQGRYSMMSFDYVKFHSNSTYREGHLLGWQGLIDFDFGCSNLCRVLLCLMEKLAEMAEQLGKMV